MQGIYIEQSGAQHTAIILSVHHHWEPPRGPDLSPPYLLSQLTLSRSGTVHKPAGQHPLSLKCTGSGQAASAAVLEYCELCKNSYCASE